MEIPFKHLVVFDIETVSQHPTMQVMPAKWQQLWEDKIRHQQSSEESSADFYQRRAAILAEFGKVVCISLGYFHFAGGQPPAFRIKSIFGHDEAALLTAFTENLLLLERHLGAICLAGHNIKEFDIPYLSRRMMVHGMAVPEFMDFQQKKPWEVNVYDTFSMWKFGDYKHFTSLDLLAACLGIPSPKADIDGSKVGEVYWVEQNLERIHQYCEQDVLTVAQVLLRFGRQELLTPEQVHIS